MLWVIAKFFFSTDVTIYCSLWILGHGRTTGVLEFVAVEGKDRLDSELEGLSRQAFQFTVQTVFTFYSYELFQFPK